LCELEILGPRYVRTGRARLHVLQALRKAIPWSTAELYKIWSISARELVRGTRREALEHVRQDLDLLCALGGLPVLGALDTAVSGVFATWP
jgi:hypothetical protein